MAIYKHGAYGEVNAVGSRVSTESQGAIVYFGTAPVHTIALGDGETYPVNTPVVVNNIAEARKYFGYSNDWAKYTLCEAMHVHFEEKGVGPLILINVLDPATHKSGTQGTASKTPVNGEFTIAEAGDIILDSVVVKAGNTAKVKGTDYTISYNSDKELITVKELTSGALGTDALTVTYNTVTPSAVTATVLIGATDGLGNNTGLYAIADVYPKTGRIPAYVAAPGFSSIPAVHAVLANITKKINGHWDAWMFTDIPIVDGSTAITLGTAYTWKKTNGYTCENEKPSFPLAEGADGNKYHLSTLEAANFQELLLDQDGIPYRSASNTDCPLVKNLYLGESSTAVYDDSIINEKLNKNGIASAAYIGGRWALWGAHAGDYDQENADPINVAETSRMMLYYISNDFQQRRMLDVDQPLTSNDLKTIVSEEQSRLDALVNMGALTYGAVSMNADLDAQSDILTGDYSFAFNITTTPLAKSLTAIVNWTDEGFVTYFQDAE